MDKHRQRPHDLSTLLVEAASFRALRAGGAARRTHSAGRARRAGATSRLFVLSAAVPLLMACGGADAAGPPPFPSAAGTYAIDILIDGFSSALAHGTGVLSFVQPDASTGSLQGSSQIVVDLATGDAITVTEVSNAAISETGTITFDLGVPNPGSLWRFTGARTPSGFLSGTHRLSNPTAATFTGTWTATPK